jgi:poly-gamma-glutamate synthesis protein (capsule biosynthesis protein)
MVLLIMKKAVISILFVVSFLVVNAQGDRKDTLSLLFIGDIMGHDSQINAAYDTFTKKYNYEGVFDKVSHLFKSNDFVIANLEVTLAGKPFKGYPRFSSPDELAVAMQNSGINVFMTANNHACDRGKSGIIRTINVLDSLGIRHTGTFKSSLERTASNLLVLAKNNFKIGLINYTYGTNGLPVPFPTIVNRIDTTKMVEDIALSQAEHLDKLIVVIHWGKEYSSQPSSSQINLAEFLFKHGVDIIIGSHPHVIQPMEYYQSTENLKERFIAYSLGNFFSNQRKRKTDGGAMVKLSLVKTNKGTAIANSNYYLTWVNKPIVKGARKFEIISCKEYERNGFAFLDEASIKQMNIFIKDSRELLQEENIGIEEYDFIK